MKTTYSLLIGVLAIGFAACIPSVKPFYLEKDLVHDPRLTGEWQAQSSSDDLERWRFEDAGDKGYRLTLTDDSGKKGIFDARLFKLGEQHFLDLVAKECDFAPEQADIVAASVFPGHLLVRVSWNEAELSVAFFDFDWLQGQMEQHPASLAHHTESDRYLLTAEVVELQAFVRRHLDDGLFGKFSVLRRASGGEPGAE